MSQVTKWVLQIDVTEEKFTLLDTIRINPVAEPTKDANKVEKYEVCYILRKNKI